MNNQELLNQLRAIHLPAKISFWPLAMGWYFLIGFFVIGVALLTYILIVKWRKEYVKRLVLQRLHELENSQSGDHNTTAQELSMLLKRAALAKYHRREVAGLYGEGWLHFLDRTSATSEFSTGSGRILIVSPYQSCSEKIPDSLFLLIRNWVKKNL